MSVASITSGSPQLPAVLGDSGTRQVTTESEAAGASTVEAARLRGALNATSFDGAAPPAPVALTADQTGPSPVAGPTFRVNPATGQLTGAAATSDGRVRALSARGIEREAELGPYPGVSVSLNGQVVALNAIVAQGAQLSTRERMSLVSQLVDQNVPLAAPGTSPLTVNGIDLATTTHLELDVGAALQRISARGAGTSEDRAIIQAELLAQMGVPRDTMQVSYGNVCDPSGRALFSQAQLMVLAPADDGRPYANTTRSQWCAMEFTSGGQPKSALESAGRIWCYANGRVSYLPREINGGLGQLSSFPPVDNSRGFFVPVFGVQVAGGFLGGRNVVDYSKVDQLEQSLTGGASYISIERSYQLMKLAPSFVENRTPTQVLYDRYERECHQRAWAQQPGGQAAPHTLSYLTRVRDWTDISAATLAHLGLPASASASFVERLTLNLHRAAVVEASFNVPDVSTRDWLRSMGTMLPDGTSIDAGPRPLTVDQDGYLVGVSLTLPPVTGP